MRMRRAHACLLAGFVALVLAQTLGCADEQRVLYSLEWDTTGAQRSQSGDAWTLDTDLGYRVQLAEGFLVSHSVELVECDARPQPLAQALLDSLSTLAVRPARAGHAPSLNPSAFRSSYVEPIVAAAPTTTSRVLVGGRRYCDVDYLIARADVSAVGLPKAVDMVGKSLYLRGVYAARRQRPVPFTIATTVASGRRAGLFRPGHFGDEEFRAVFDASSGDVVVRLRRRLAGMFDGVDFARSPERDWPHRILANLVDDMTVVYEPGGANP